MIGKEIALKKGEEQIEIEIPKEFATKIKPFKLKLLNGQLLTALWSTQYIEVPVEEKIVIEMEKNNSGIKLNHTMSREFSFDKSPFLIKRLGNRERKVVVGSHEERLIYLFVQKVSYKNHQAECVVLRFEISMYVEEKTFIEKLLKKFNMS